MMTKAWCRRSRFTSFIVSVLIGVCFIPVTVFAGAGDDTGEDSPTATKIAEGLAGKRAKSPGIEIKEHIIKKVPRPALPEGPTLITEIRIIGATLIAQESIDKLKNDYENRKLTARELQDCADLITRAYSREGYITSYGYISDPAKINSGILEITVKEGKTGTITIQGNKYFSTEVLRKKITLQEGEYFNFRQLMLDVYRINRNPRRKMSVSCEPNIDTGLTNVVLTVKDVSPWQTMYQMDNYGSEYIGYERYKVYVTDYNLTGHDDSLQFKAQATEGDSHRLFDFDYFLPLNNDWKFEFYYMPYKLEDYLCGDNVDTDFEKHARKFYFNFFQSLINEPDNEFVSSYGFVFKDIRWWQYGSQRKADTFSALMWGLDFNRADPYGRWVVSNDLEIGLPRFLGASTAKDDSCSVPGAGGGYKKNHLVVARRQKLFSGVDFIGKMHWQVSSQALTGVNVFSMGGFMGVIDNRGYPRAQAPGDSGLSLTGGFSFPAYGLSNKLNTPFSRTKLYDNLKLFTFYDWGQAVLKSPQPDQDERTTLASAGVGFTLGIPDRAVQIRLDIGWPLTTDKQKPKDGDNVHTWWAFTKMF